MEAYSAREWEPSEITVRQSGQVKYERVTGYRPAQGRREIRFPGIYHSLLDLQFHFRNWYELKYRYNSLLFLGISSFRMIFCVKSSHCLHRFRQSYILLSANTYCISTHHRRCKGLALACSFSTTFLSCSILLLAMPFDPYMLL